MNSSAERTPLVIIAGSNDEDRAFARKLQRDLERHAFTINVLTPHDLHPEFRQTAQRLAMTAQHILIILSPEITAMQPIYAKALHQGGTIIPLLIRPIDALPTELSAIQWISFYELYPKGLARLLATLHIPQYVIQKEEKEAQQAHRRGLLINGGRVLLAIGMAYARITAINALPYQFRYFTDSFHEQTEALFLGIFLIPFLEAVEEEHRRERRFAFRVLITRAFLGGIGGGAVFYVITAFEYVGIYYYTLQALMVFGGAVVGVGGLFLEHFYANRGYLLWRRLLRISGFCVKALIIFVALAPLPLGQNGWLKLGMALLFGFLVEYLIAPERAALRGTITPFTPGFPQTHQVFVSYSRDQSLLVDKLVRRLQMDGFRVWIDRQVLVAGDEWEAQLHRAITDADIFLLVLSTQAQQSPAVQHECDLAVQLQKHIVVAQLEEGIATSPKTPAALVPFWGVYEQDYLHLITALGAAPPLVARTQAQLIALAQQSLAMMIVRSLGFALMALSRGLLYNWVTFVILGNLPFDSSHLNRFLVNWLIPIVPLFIVSLIQDGFEEREMRGYRNSTLAFMRILTAGLDSLLIGTAVVFYFAFLTYEVKIETALVVAPVFAVIGVLLSVFFIRSERRNIRQGRYGLYYFLIAWRFGAKVLIVTSGIRIVYYFLFESYFGIMRSLDGRLLQTLCVLVGILLGCIVAYIQLYLVPPFRESEDAQKALVSLAATK